MLRVILILLLSPFYRGTESPLNSKEIKPDNLKENQPWIFIGRIDAEAPILWPTWCEEKTCLKRPWCWERLKAGGEGDDRGWDGWMASLIWWTGVWVSSGSWWWTGKPGMLQSVGLQRVRHDWATELNELKIILNFSYPQKGSQHKDAMKILKMRELSYSQQSQIWIEILQESSSHSVFPYMSALGPPMFHISVSLKRNQRKWQVRGQIMF